ncbi:MAG: hypothetical protein JRH20_23020 [Deltaproteobacteria bacterium]|nr:hypothetical protein [Deltaproteobacteria bacterium]
MLAAAARLKLTFVVTLACLGHSYGAHGHLPPSYGGRLEVPLSDRPLSFNPTLAQRPSELQLVRLQYDTLFVLRGGRPVAHLLREAPQRSADKLSWSFLLRENVLTHDGKPLTAQEVMASLQAARRGPHGYLFAVIKGIFLRKGRMIIRLKHPEPRLGLLLSTPASAIAVPRGGRILGTGPFTRVRHSAARVKLVAHALHFAGRPYLQGLRLRIFSRASEEAAALQVGATQLSFHGESVFGGQPRHPTRTLDVASFRTLFLATGSRRAYLDDATAQRMLAVSIHRDRLARVAGALTRPARELVDPLVDPLNDRHRGKKLFDRALAARLRRVLARRFSQLKEPHVDVSLLVDRSRPADGALVAQLVADLDRVGLTLQVERVSARLYAQRVARRDYDLALLQHAPQLAEVHIALAGVLALGKMLKAAVECAAARCDLDQGAQRVGRLALIPLVHMGRRVHYDARVAGLRARSSGRLSYADVFWLRSASQRKKARRR